ncbi:Dihydropteroate synthase [hydrothermal vent metagenome]|uniref:dihydropteroate synthase n=1 Tax=hydrothermal vent metagenome TaxID=652676 RepID=A0A3B1BCR8_9ZZZZ
MGILNVTPDSFSDGGRFTRIDKAITQAEKMVEEGATIIDVGGESSRPGADPVSKEEEAKRVLPVIRLIVKKFPKTPVSIDSYKPEVTLAAMEEGAAMINDITGLRDTKMMEVAARFNAPVVIMHMKGTPQTMQKRPAYKNVTLDIATFFKERIKTCSKNGIDKIVVDPGIGFGKTVNHNLQIINRLDEFAKLGRPVMIGHSRKSFIGKILGDESTERETATAAITAMAVKNGASIIRIHNVLANRQAAMIASAVRGVG